MTSIAFATAGSLRRGDRFVIPGRMASNVYTVLSMRRRPAASGDARFDIVYVTYDEWGSKLRFYAYDRLELRTADRRLMLTRRQTEAYDALLETTYLFVNQPYRRSTLQALVENDLATWSIGGSYIEPTNYAAMLSRADDADALASAAYYAERDSDFALDRELKRRNDQ